MVYYSKLGEIVLYQADSQIGWYKSNFFKRISTAAHLICFARASEFIQFSLTLVHTNIIINNYGYSKIRFNSESTRRNVQAD